MSKPSAVAKTKVRCAIYTRKSTEDGLEQEYNSLDAQHDACAAYILSQRHEGWTLLPTRYDDGGFSGGSMDRPGLTRLMVDVAAGKVDTIVIYKVDRLTRSLADFAKIVEVLDGAQASFVSVTQAFNTTTSMGRLTLNMLLSFAQFEREVTGERIRDKIAASKRKGLWMGGPVPLGYDVRDRKLVVNEAEAELVRHIFRRYPEIASVQALADELTAQGHRTKLQARASGPHRGGCPFRRGTLYHLLANRIYLGCIVHKGESHPGEHPAIVEQPLWDAVQTKLAERGPGLMRQRAPNCSALVRLLTDGLGRAMTPTHAGKGGKRYRYYVTREPSSDQPAWRVRARDVEQAVAERLRALLTDRNRIARMVVRTHPRRIEQAVATARALAGEPLLGELPALGVEQVRLDEQQLTVTLNTQTLLGRLELDVADAQPETILLEIAIERVRRGHELRLIVAADAPTATPLAVRDDRLVALLAESLRARTLMLAAPERLISEVAAQHQRCRKRLGKLVRLSFLAPDIVQTILRGDQPATLTPARLLDAELPIDWRQQRKALDLA